MQVVLAPIASVVVGQLTAGAVPVPEKVGSVTDSPVMAMLPVLVTRNA